MLVVNFGVKYFSNLIFKFTLYIDWRRRGLDSIWNFIRNCRFKHRNVEDRVNSANGVW